jgi:hypothetical protein
MDRKSECKAHESDVFPFENRFPPLRQDTSGGNDGKLGDLRRIGTRAEKLERNRTCIWRRGGSERGLRSTARAIRWEA